MEHNLLYHKGKRPNASKENVLKELIDYVKSEYARAHIPSKRELQNKFHLRLDIKIEDLYEKAGLKYRLIANQSIKSEKASILLRVVINNLDRLGFELIESRGVREKGVDIVAKKNNRKIGIELKAYNQFEKIKLRNIKQAERFIKNENLDEVIIISTSNLRDNIKLPTNIKLITYNNLLKIIKEQKDIDNLNYIRDTSINIDTATKKINRQKILDYTHHKYVKEGKKVAHQDISRDLHLKVNTYFRSLFDIYKILKIPPPLRNMGGLRAKNPNKEVIELWKEEFKKFISNEIKKGNKYPSGVEIAQHFDISNIWNITKVSDLYKELGLKPYFERGKGSRATFYPKLQYEGRYLGEY